mgnify:CR=1 FL=1
MKELFSKLDANKGKYGFTDLVGQIQPLVEQIISTDDRLLSVSKRWVGYGTWSSVGFANSYTFGGVLAGILTKALTNRITHDEDKEFVVADFEEDIEEVLFEHLY